MMNAAPLPPASSPMPPSPLTQEGGAAAGFAAFLADIGQAATGATKGETGGFEPLHGEAPPLPASDLAPDITTDLTSMVAAAIGGGRGEAGETAEEEQAMPDAAPDAMPAALLDALSDALIIEGLLAALTSAPATTAPAKGEAAATAPDAPPAPPMPPAALLAASKPAPAPPMAAVLVAEPPPAAKPIDGGAAMTVLFPQAAPEASAAIGETAKPVPVATRTLDLSNDDIWIEQLARDIVAAKSNSGDISFRLMPRHLGRLDVAMRVEEGGVALKLDTQHEATAKIVTAAQVRLVDDLRQQGIRVAGAEVTCTPGETGRHQQQGQGRASATPDAAHLIETAAEAEPRDENRPADRRGRFA